MKSRVDRGGGPLPSAQQALHFSTDDRQWIVTAYALTFGSLLLLGGKLGDLFGRKWTFVAGLLGFAGASALGGLAPSFAVLVAARPPRCRCGDRTEDPECLGTVR
jgi:MFS family permease